VALATNVTRPDLTTGQCAAEKGLPLQPIGEASAITVVLGLIAGSLLMAALGLSLARAARRGDLPADRYTTERSPSPPQRDPIEGLQLALAERRDRRRRPITEPPPPSPSKPVRTPGGLYERVWPS
jgi:hypothetical protein